MDVEQYTSNELLSKIDNVDAVLDGHTHLIYNTTSKDKDNNEIHISQTGTKLESIGKLIIKKDGTIASEIIKEIPEPSNKANAIKLTRGKIETWVDKDINNFINDKFSIYEDLLNELYGSSEYELVIRPEGSTDSHSIYCRYQECTVGNLLADAFKATGKSDAAIVNGGTVRSNLNKGNLTRSQIMAIAPFFNNVIVKEISGQGILDALEFGVSKYPLASGGFPQVSGIIYDIDTSLNSTVETDPQGLFLNITGKRRVSNVKINGKDIDPNKNYTVSMSEYIGNGGDGYEMLSKYDVIQEGLLTDTDSLSYYIKNHLNGKIPEEYKDLQGRINLVNGSKSNDNFDFSRINQRKSSQGLSTGGIIAIIIPTVAALIAVAIISVMCSRKNVIDNHTLNKVNSSLSLKS